MLKISCCFKIFVVDTFTGLDKRLRWNKTGRWIELEDFGQLEQTDKISKRHRFKSQTSRRRFGSRFQWKKIFWGSENGVPTSLTSNKCLTLIFVIWCHSNVDIKSEKDHTPWLISALVLSLSLSHTHKSTQSHILSLSVYFYSLFSLFLYSWYILSPIICN